jgi:hypothetical protein
LSWPVFPLLILPRVTAALLFAVLVGLTLLAGIVAATLLLVAAGPVRPGSDCSACRNLLFGQNARLTT